MAIAVTGMLVTGCKQAPPEFKANEVAIVDGQLVPEHAQQIASVLESEFGTPDNPAAPKLTGLDIDKLRMAAGPAGYVKDDTGAEFLQRGLYRQHCATCHGITGDGAGPAASVLAPYPRDFRSSVFKWKSTELAAKPTDADLLATLERGVPGTAMPSFALLDQQQLEALVEYVKYLSMRGQVERRLIATVADDFDFDPAVGTADQPLDPATDPQDRALVDGIVRDVARSWSEAAQRVVHPADDDRPTDDRSVAKVAESIEQGRELFASQQAKCTDCHSLPGHPVAAKDYDDWNAVVVAFRRDTAALAAAIDRQREQLLLLDDSQRDRAEDRIAADERQLRRRQQVEATQLKPELARPRTLVDGVFRGGGAPDDLFRRLHQGIAGTPMPGHGSPRPGVPGALTDAEIWQLVDYLLHFASPDGE